MKIAKLKIENSDNNEVASIDASGSAHFANLALDKYLNATSSAAVIAAAENFAKNGLYAPAIETEAKTAGVGRLPKGQKEIVVYNEKITDGSLIYITPTSSTSGNSLYLDNKESCSQKTAAVEPPRLDTINNDRTSGVNPSGCKSYFKVAIDTIISKDIEFNWWIVN